LYGGSKLLFLSVGYMSLLLGKLGSSRELGSFSVFSFINDHSFYNIVIKVPSLSDLITVNRS
jgi:hypothetical protein